MPSARIEELQDLYDASLNETWAHDDFLPAEISESRKIFTPESLDRRIPVTKKYEVWAWVWGAPLPYCLTKELEGVQQQVKEILGSTMAYFVEPRLQGTELSRLKMPEDELTNEEIDRARRVARVYLSEECPFQVDYEGIGITPKAVLVAKGYDSSGVVPKIRRELESRVHYASKNQSSLVHIPLGRILEQVGPKKFERLKEFVYDNWERPLGNVIVSRINLVHERQWYDEKEVIDTIPLHPGNVF